MSVKPYEGRRCIGTLRRRAFLRFGLAGWGSLGLADLLRCESQASAAGGGLRMGQVIGSTTAKGEEPAERPVSPNDLLATWYQYLGVPLDMQFTDHFGRPISILSHGTPIRELI